MGSCLDDGSGVRSSGLWAMVAALLVAFFVLVVGTHELQGSQYIRPSIRLLDDGQLTLAEADSRLPATHQEPTNETSGADRCKPALDRYGSVVDLTRLPTDAPFRVTVSNAPTGVPATCEVFDERQSGRAVISLLLTTALAGVAVLVGFAGWWLRRWAAARCSGWWGPSGVAVLVLALTIGMAGRFGREWHMIIASGVVALAIVPCVRILLAVPNSLKVALQDEPPDRTVSGALERLARLRFSVRTSVFLLSVVLSLSVALTAALNARDLATRGKVKLGLYRLPFMSDTHLGGIEPEQVGLLTGLQGLVFAAFLVALATPALLRTEHLGGQLLEDLVPDESGSLKLDETRAAGSTASLDCVLKRDSLGKQLGLSTRPVAWLENLTAALAPLATGVLAEFVGLVG